MDGYIDRFTHARTHSCTYDNAYMYLNIYMYQFIQNYQLSRFCLRLAVLTRISGPHGQEQKPYAKLTSQTTFSFLHLLKDFLPFRTKIIRLGLEPHHRYILGIPNQCLTCSNQLTLYYAPVSRPGIRLFVFSMHQKEEFAFPFHCRIKEICENVLC